MKNRVNTPRLILHIDMDAFFASVEQRDNPALRGKPVLVGGRDGRAVVCAASYEARKFGCAAAMPMMNALRLCPHAVTVSPRFAAYSAVSAAMREIFERYSPQIEPLSLDEAFVDVSASLALFGTARAIGEAIRAAIAHELQLTCSVGIGPNKFVAKIASDLEKPNALVEFDAATLAERLAPLPLRRMWGVGPVAEASLRAEGLETFGDVQRAGITQLTRRFGDAGRTWFELAHGIEDREVESSRESKSVGEEETFPVDIDDRAKVEAHLLSQADTVARRLREKQLFAQVLTIKIRFGDFATHTHAKSLLTPTDHTHELRDAARQLLREFEVKEWRAVRLCGFTASRLTASLGQLPLFDEPKRAKLATLDDLRDQIHRRLGR